ncbi:MAG: hypothetical protein K6E79_02535, partial [Pseudobutyrivibrio sp.]|nr:hypothetical protein [Pseudobutyrivibrio sp.]
ALSSNSFILSRLKLFVNNFLNLFFLIFLGKSRAATHLSQLVNSIICKAFCQALFYYFLLCFQAIMLIGDSLLIVSPRQAFVKEFLLFLCRYF